MASCVAKLHRIKRTSHVASQQLVSIVRLPVVQQVDEVLHNAIDLRASDIHVEPYEEVLRVRYRINGVLQTIAELDVGQASSVASRLKVLASLDIAEKRRPQDGRIRLHHAGRDVDFRVSVLPTNFGEKVVLRVLDKGALRLDLDELGFDGSDLERFRAAIGLPYGIVLVTGPTGSGKTTTLYAALSELNRSSVNITTVEDPIEFDLPGINQVRARADLEFGFAEALRSILRQDPDIVMIGEIRDVETARIAVRSALTGHLVLSTLHTNDAPSAIARLADMGIEPFLLAASVRFVMAQRLVRVLCPECKQQEGEGYSRGGCASCSESGYAGRRAIGEVVTVDEGMTELISGGESTQRLAEKAAEQGMRTLKQRAGELVQAGLTDRMEVLRAIG